MDSRPVVLLPHRFTGANPGCYFRSQPATGGQPQKRECHRMSQPRFRYLDTLIHVFVVVLIVSNLVGPKITAIGPFRVSGAQWLFPITYIFGDVFTEVYGYAASRRAIWTGFFASG